MEKVLRPGDIIWITTGQRPLHHKADRSPFVVVSSELYNSTSGRLIVCPVVWGDEPGEFRVSIPEPCDVTGVVFLDRICNIDPTEVDAVYGLSCPASTTLRITAALGKLLG